MPSNLSGVEEMITMPCGSNRDFMSAARNAWHVGFEHTGPERQLSWQPNAAGDLGLCKVLRHDLGLSRETTERFGS